MNAAIRDVWIIARYELAESVRSRRAVIVLLLFLVAGVLACNGVVSSVHRVEKELSKTLGLPESSSAGVVTDALWNHKTFQNMMHGLIGDRKVTEELLSVPPMAIVFSWFAFMFTPLFIMMVASGRMADEIGSASVRFIALRAPRSAWCAGKYLGQALLLIVALMLAAIGAWCVFRFRLTGLDNLAMAKAMVIYAWKVWLYSLSFIGLALGVSMVTRSANQAIIIGCFIWIAFSIIAALARYFEGEGWRQLWSLFLMLIPMGHRTDMWRLDLAHQVQAAFYLVTLGAVYMTVGYSFFARKDL